MVISIHVLRVEDDGRGSNGTHSRWRFQSTSSVWRTTRPPGLSCARLTHFNPRPPCGGRHIQYSTDDGSTWISIHVLRVEDDAKFVFMRFCVGREISIHVLRVEDDSPSLFR